MDVREKKICSLVAKATNTSAQNLIKKGTTMNNARRKEIQILCEKLTEILAGISATKDEEKEYYNNIAKALQDGKNGKESECAINYLDGAEQALEETISRLEGAAG
ncbi:hypothetical protein [Roseibium sp. RKSG952]|uniref:hypothetical protein n=1 Tax=Roseibium sp. RKSG952 TaxID=2529384 RepID=UPI0012BD5940|nr:hypothetical protein [Roseibium sp. RKSG952]MTH94712.1 hypothetical protein [Roseibium sp. RKSG952]